MSRFHIDVPDDVLADLRRRLAATRLPAPVTADDDWSWGTPPGELGRLIAYWRDGYDWRRTERRLNAIEQGRIEVDGLGIHFFRAGRRGATPLLLLHGWPDTPLRFEKALPLLAERFDLVIPSIPGYGFSDRPTSPGYGPLAVADLLAGLMAALGHDRFGVHGGDIGSTIGESLALRHPERVIALHLVDVPFWRRYATIERGLELEPEEVAYFAAMSAWVERDAAYAAMQRTKPQTLACSLDDSPAGLAAWMLEKFQAWSDCGGDVWARFSRDEILDAITVYWVTQTGGSSVRYYRDAALARSSPDDLVTVPTGFAIFPKDIPPAPRVFAERFFNVTRWSVMERGGHFGAWEEPRAFADELIAFFS